MEDVNRKLELIAENKAYNADLLLKIKNTITEAIVKNDFLLTEEILAIYNDKKFVLTGETARVKMLILLYAREAENRNKDFFYEGTCDYNGLFQKYLKTIMMLRRIDVRCDDDMVDEAYEFLKDISPEAIVLILDKELFERKEAVAVEAYNRLHSEEDFVSKAEWLMTLYKQYKEQWMLDEINRMRGQVNE